MVERYKKIFVKLYTETDKSASETGRWLTELLDKILLWIISLSTGSIVLIITSSNPEKYVSGRTLKVTLILLVISIIVGILGRIFNAISSYIFGSLNESVRTEFRLMSVPYNPRKIKGDESEEYIYLAIKEDFDFDLPSPLKESNSSSLDKQLMDQKARETYESVKEYCKKSFEIALNEVNRKMNTALGYSEKDLEKRKKDNPRNKRIIADWLQLMGRTLSIASGLLFLFSIGNFVIQYVLHN